MQHITVLLLTVSFPLGVFTTGVSFSLYQKYRENSILYFSLFMTGFFLDVLSFLIWHYAEAAGISDLLFVFYLNNSVNKGAGLLLLFSIPLFIHSLIKSRNKFEHILYKALLIFQLSVFYFIVSNDLLIEKISKMPLYAAILFILVFTIIQLKNVGDKIIRKAVYWVVIAACIEVPVILLKEGTMQ